MRFALLICSELIPIAFILIRPIAQTISRGPSDWMFAIVGPALSLFIMMAPSHPLVPGAMCYIIVVAGITLQLLAKIFLGSSFEVVAANRRVKVGGPYSYIRHPMYAAYTLTHVGLLLAMPSVGNLLLYAGAFALQVIRMGREEATLLQDGKYREFSGLAPTDVRSIGPVPLHRNAFLAGSTEVNSQLPSQIWWHRVFARKPQIPAFLTFLN